MVKTCIVCGNAAGSKEHVFPASFGGRRTDKGIYCSTHDNGYSSLVNVLANQLDIFNAQLGVINDHTKGVRGLIVSDPHSGFPLKISAAGSSFVRERIISGNDSGGNLKISFPSQESMDDWIEEKRKTHKVIVKDIGKPLPYLLDTINVSRIVGGDVGLGAVAYIAQTFLAQAFPHLVRSEALANFIAYTQAIAALACAKEQPDVTDDVQKKMEQNLETALSAFDGVAPICWDFESQQNVHANPFLFGHRIIVGVDSQDGQIFGRVSLFSTLNFLIYFGSTCQNIITKTIITDIDPLAKYPPDDISKIEINSSIYRVMKPSGLRFVMDSGRRDFEVSRLLNKINEHSLAQEAKEIHSEFSAYSANSEMDLRELIHDILDGRRQRIWNLAKWVVNGLKIKFSCDEKLTELIPILDAFIKHDSLAPNGLSPLASDIYELAKNALFSQMLEDFKNGSLDESRIVQLMGGGAGGEVVGKLIFLPLIEGLKNN